MKSYAMELITPCFSAGARPREEAEIRVPTIRGQLRWWFRVLGGFRSLARVPLVEQERSIFGGVGGEPMASKLIVRIKAPRASTISTVVKDADQLGAAMNTPEGYVLFPLRRNPRAVFTYDRLPKFELLVLWHGAPELEKDMDALIAVLGHLGSIGFRSRRGMGALAFQRNPPDLHTALKRFHRSEDLCIRYLRAHDARDAVRALAGWLKGWRSYGRTIDHERAQPPDPPHNAGFKFAKNDHDVGYGTNLPTTYRPALGLPIIQRIDKGTVNWTDTSTTRAAGRFASPVLLRPHRDAQGNWKALVVFVDERKWPAGKKVYVDGRPQNVSLDLYEAMKGDDALSSLPDV